MIDTQTFEKEKKKSSQRCGCFLQSVHIYATSVYYVRYTWPPTPHRYYLFILKVFMSAKDFQSRFSLSLSLGNRIPSEHFPSTRSFAAFTCTAGAALWRSTKREENKLGVRDRTGGLSTRETLSTSFMYGEKPFRVGDIYAHQLRPRVVTFVSPNAIRHLSNRKRKK